MTTPQTGPMPGFEIPAALAATASPQRGRADEHRQAVRLRRLDRRCAQAIGAAAICTVAYTTGSRMRAWEPVLPDAVLWTLTVVLLGAAVALVSFSALWSWLRDWWPYRHNQILATGVEVEGGPRAGGVQ